MTASERAIFMLTVIFAFAAGAGFDAVVNQMIGHHWSNAGIITLYLLITIWVSWVGARALLGDQK